VSDGGFVIDASAALAVLLDEPQADRVVAFLSGGAMSAVNFSEVVAKLQERGMPDRAIDLALEHLNLDVVAFDQTQATSAGKLRARTRSAGLSLGDRACLALASALAVPAVTMDRGWAKVDAGAEVVVARD
jgi:PIN domain nuclease of toxin-antitoxin system